MFAQAKTLDRFLDKMKGVDSILEKNVDLRISRTHKMIKGALLELMDEIGFEKITVQNLTSKAMISRTTFYLHYKDKYDLLDQIENELLEGFKNLSGNLPKGEMVTVKGSDEKAFMLLIKIYEHVNENQQFFKLFMSNPSFHYKMNETLKQVIGIVIKENRLKIPEHYAISFIIGFHTSIMTEWLNSGMKETPYEIALMIAQVMQDVPKRIFTT